MSNPKLVFAVLAAILVLSCGLFTATGSGNVVTQEEAFTGFDKVDVSQAFNVVITQGEDFDVVIRVDDNFVEDLRVVKEGSTLRIGLNPNRDYNTFNATLEAEITMPDLVGLDLSGSSDANVNGFESTEPFYVDLSGNSTLRGDLEAGDTRFDISGNSSVTLTGSAGYVLVDAAGDSEADLAEFPAINATAGASGSSTVTVNVIGGLDADASGGSRIYYLGDPTLGVINSSGSSTIQSR